MNLLKNGLCGIAVACALALPTADAKAQEIPDLGLQLLFLIETSCWDDPDYLVLDECFDPDDAFNENRCSYLNPDICRNVALCFPEEEAPASPLFVVVSSRV